MLTRRAVAVRYRRSWLGVGWSLLLPVVSMLVLYAVFSNVFDELHDYPLYVIVGFIVWSFFSTTCIQAMESLPGHSSILRKVKISAAVFPLSVVGANVVNLLLSLLILPLLLWALGSSFAFEPLRLSVALFCLLSFVTGTALALSALNLVFRDVRYFFEALMPIVFYATPIVYPRDIVPAGWQWLLTLNPLYWLATTMRAALWGTEYAPEFLFSVSIFVSAVMLVLGWFVFARSERRFHLYL